MATMMEGRVGYQGADSVTFASGGTVSTAVETRGYNSGSILLPAEFNADVISFEGAEKSDGTFAQIYNSGGALVSFTAAGASKWYDLPAAVFGLGFLKVVTGTATGAAATVTVSLRCGGVGTDATAISVTADTEMPAAAALADGTTNPTTTLVGSMLEVWNGTTWDRAPGTAANGTKVQPAVGGAGAVTAVTARTTLASDDPAVVALQIMDDWDNAASDGASVSGDVAHDSPDAGEPVKIGGKAASALPTAVAANDRANAVTDLFGRIVTAPNIPGEASLSKAINVTTTQTGSDVLTPTAGKRLAITHLTVSSYATTAGRVILWFGANADTTYSAGTDQPLWLGSFAPSATATPGAVVPYHTPVYCTTADFELHLTTDAAMSLDIVVHYFEW